MGEGVIRYKIVRRLKGGGLYSAFTYSADAEVYYRPRIEARPRRRYEEWGYGLCVFDTLDHIAAFLEKNGLDRLYKFNHIEILECECHEPTKQIPSFWIDGTTATTWPVGTEHYMGVTLMQLISAEAMQLG